MTEHEAMTLKRQVFEKWATAQGFYMDLWEAAGSTYTSEITERAWKTWQASIDANLSRAAEPVSVTEELLDCAENAYDSIAGDKYSELGMYERPTNGMNPYVCERDCLRAALEVALSARPPEPARERANWYLCGDTLHLDISDDPNNQLSIMVRRDGLISYAIYFGPSDRHYGVPSGNEFLTALAQWMDSAAMAQESDE